MLEAQWWCVLPTHSGSGCTYFSQAVPSTALGEEGSKREMVLAEAWAGGQWGV